MANTDRFGTSIAVGDWCEIRGLNDKGEDITMVYATALQLLDNNECVFFCGYHPLHIPGHNIIRLSDMEQFTRRLEGNFSFFDTTPTIKRLLGERK